MNDLSEMYLCALVAQAAQDAESKCAAFRLRYNVYCLERGFEDVSRFPERMERDAYDHYACHALVRTRGLDGAPVGASRLVLDRAAQGALPIEDHGSTSVAKQLAHVRETTGCRLAEVSRLAVTRELPQRFRLPAAPARVRSQHVTLGLVALLFQQSWQHGITHWAALMEPGLIRVLARLGLHFYPIGTMIEHRGARQPVMAAVSDLWEGMQEEAPGRPVARLAQEFGVPREAEWGAAPEMRKWTS